MTALTTATLALVRAGTEVPGYDRTAVTPGILHIGVGGFHRSHQAAYLDALLGLDPAARSFGICGVSLLPQDRRIVDVLRAQDRLYTLLVRDVDGSTRARVIASIVEHLFAPDAPERVLDRMTDPSIRIVSMTITEGGYFLHPDRDRVDLEAPSLVHDREQPQHPVTAFGYILEGLRRRRAAGTAPFTVLSCDNVHGNGDVTRRVVTALAAAQDEDLAAWVASEVSFPNSMVDRITPRTSADDVQEAAALTGLDDAWPVTCEAFSQWVIEDRFPTGRPAWDRVGVQFVADVAPYELLKMRVLNAGHQTITYPGWLLGHTYGHEAATDPTIDRLLERYIRSEASLTLPELPGVDVPEYGTTIMARFANPQIRDTVARLSSEASTMLATYVLPVIRDLLDAGRPAPAAIAVVACWARFLDGVDDQGRPFAIADVHAADLQARAARHGDDLLAVVRGNPMFSGLAGRPEFERPYAETLAAVRRDGTREALEQVLAGSAPAAQPPNALGQTS
jgi:mannitol 2-dehydrogenase